MQSINPPVANSCSIERPLKSTQGLFTKVQSLSGPDIQIITGAELARVRKCFSRSRSKVSAVSSFSTCLLPRWRSSTTAANTRMVIE